MSFVENLYPIPHYHDLFRYCRMLTGTPWDGEDLLQETIIKVLKSVPSTGRGELPKAYLFRIATNAWIDVCRKKKYSTEQYEEDQHSTEDEQLSLNIGEAIEKLVHRLQPKSAAIVLLVDVFQFTTWETADLFGDTNNGAVKTALRRARQKLVKMACKDDKDRKSTTFDIRKLIADFTDAFRRHDPLAVIQAYKSLSGAGIQIERRIASSRIFFTFVDPEGNMMMISI